jgi:hypothetical protein
MSRQALTEVIDTMLKRLTPYLLATHLLLSFGWAQSAANLQQDLSSKEDPRSMLHLTPLETVVSAEVASAFLGPFVCDGDGNLYLHSESAGVTAIRKLNPKGERTALFEPAANPDVKISVTGSFSVNPDGDLYMLAFAAEELNRYVLVFKPDGTYKTKIKLDPGFAWVPSAIAVFPNGSLLVTGQEYARDRNAPKLPFTGIFRSDGKLLKELNLEDDDAIQDMANGRDPRVTSLMTPASNRAISWSQIESAKDGNLYLMRWLSPAVFYAISPSGQVVRRFAVDPGNTEFRPAAMHISGNRIALLFYQPQSMEKIMKIVDLEGHELSTYMELREDGKPKLGMLGAAFACYRQQPERFTFLVSDEHHKIELKHAGAR